MWGLSRVHSASASWLTHQRYSSPHVWLAYVTACTVRGPGSPPWQEWQSAGGGAIGQGGYGWQPPCCGALLDMCSTTCGTATWGPTACRGTSTATARSRSADSLPRRVQAGVAQPWVGGWRAGGRGLSRPCVPGRPMRRVPRGDPLMAGPKACGVCAHVGGKNRRR